MSETFVKIAAGTYSAAISNTGDINIWRTGLFGTYLVPKKIYSVNIPIKDIKIGGNFGIAQDMQGKLWSWGTNSSGELGMKGPNGKASPTMIDLNAANITFYSCGSSHTVAISEDEFYTSIDDRAPQVQINRPEKAPRKSSLRSQKKLNMGNLVNLSIKSIGQSPSNANISNHSPMSPRLDCTKEVIESLASDSGSEGKRLL